MIQRIPFIDGEFDFWPLYDSGQWEPETKAVIDRFFHGDIYENLWDIGAWIGPVTLWAAATGAIVHAFEPDPVAFKQLKWNTCEYPRVSCHQIAVARSTGPRKLACYREDFGYGDSQSRLANTGIDVTAMSPADMARTYPTVVAPTLVKIDVEGGEWEILPGLIEATRHASPLLISWHEPWWPAAFNPTDRGAWFVDYELEPIRGDGWTGFSELLAVPRRLGGS